MAHETAEEKKARFLGQVDEGAREFVEATGRAPKRTPRPRPAPPAPDPGPGAESFAFQEPAPARLSLRKRGWVDATHLYDPRVLKATKAMAADLGIYFAELQNLALGLLVDPTMRSPEAQAIIDRVREQAR